MRARGKRNHKFRAKILTGKFQHDYWTFLNLQLTFLLWHYGAVGNATGKFKERNGVAQWLFTGWRRCCPSPNPCKRGQIWFPEMCTVSHNQQIVLIPECIGNIEILSYFFILQSSKMRKFQTLKLSQFHSKNLLDWKLVV